MNPQGPPGNVFSMQQTPVFLDQVPPGIRPFAVPPGIRPTVVPPGIRPTVVPPGIRPRAMGAADMSPGATVYAAVSTASMAASAYHGYKRNNSIGWALMWGLAGAMFPVITPVIAVAQGFGERKRGR